MTSADPPQPPPDARRAEPPHDDLAVATRPGDIRAVLAALERLRGADVDPAVLRAALLARFAHLAENGPRRDPGGLIRAALVRALRGRLRADDVPFLEAGALHYEVVRGVETASSLRAECLAALDDLDEPLALAHAARLLFDPRSVNPTPDAVITAVRLLGERSDVRTLYLHVLHGTAHPAVLAECLRRLVALPASLIPSLLDRFEEPLDDAVGVGLLDLLIDHEAWERFASVVAERIASARSEHVFHFGAVAVVASRKAPLIAGLLELAEAERRPGRLRILAEALALRAHEPAVRRVVEGIERRLGG